MDRFISIILALSVVLSCKSGNSSRNRPESLGAPEDPMAQGSSTTQCAANTGLELVELNCLSLVSGQEARDLYQSMEKKFREIEHKYSDKDWINKAVYLDVIDELVRVTENKIAAFEPLAFTYDVNDPKEQNDFSKETYIPLVYYHALDEASRRWGEFYARVRTQVPAHHSGLTLGNLRSVLGDSLRAEYSEVGGILSMAKLVDLTTEKQWFNVFRIGSSDLVLRKVTDGQKSKNNQFLDADIRKWKIAKFSNQVAINSSEIVPYYGPARNRQPQFVYRGPNYLFGRQLKDYSTINDWFKRDLTPQARADYLQEVRNLEQELLATYSSVLPARTDGSPVASQYIISPADARLRFETLYRGRISILQQLTGKIVSSEAQIQALSSKGDNPFDYSREYTFNIKELLGRANTSEKAMGIRKVSHDSTQPLGEVTIHAAQHEILSAIYRELSRAGTLQVIERLAPADVHNYVAPANGKALSHLEAVRFFQERARLWRTYYANTIDPKRQAQLEAEIKHFDGLAEIFTRQEATLGRPSQATIDIYGTNLSVSAPAIKNRSNILAQNDRKVMVFRHDGIDPEDSRFSIHVFIGATGVNKVDVDPRTDQLRQGDRTGDMQFGPDEYDPQPPFQGAGGKSTRDGSAKVRTGKNLGAGDYLGEFPIDGSTIISYYPEPYFAMLPKVARYRHWDYYEDSFKNNTLTKIEIKAQMGNTILLSREILAVELLRLEGIDSNSHPSIESAIGAYIDRKMEADIVEVRFLKDVRALLFKKRLNPNEEFVRKTLLRLWER